jgi:hypothetical protein
VVAHVSFADFYLIQIHLIPPWIRRLVNSLARGLLLSRWIGFDNQRLQTVIQNLERVLGAVLVEPEDRAVDAVWDDVVGVLGQQVRGTLRRVAEVEQAEVISSAHSEHAPERSTLG